MARAKGLAALAVTDHDTIDGLAEAREEAGRAGIELVNGVELSVKWDDGTFHLLGYLFHDGPEFAAGLEKLKALRRERNEKMVAKLNELGFTVTMDEVRAASGGGQIGRPHMAKALVARGHVPTIHDAFERLLRKGRPAYVVVERLLPSDAFHLIRAAGGVPVLAHPFQLKLAPDALASQVAAWAREGLGGLEVQHSSHSPEREEVLASIAKRNDLAATGGSDFHGETKPDVALGSAWGGTSIPYARLEDLKRRARA